MKKRFVIALLLSSVVSSSVFANVDYKFDLFSLDPLHKEYFADKGRADLSVNYLHFSEGFPDIVLQDTSDGRIKVWDISDHMESNDVMMQYKLGETISLFRNTFRFDSWISPISFDLSAQALLQSFYTAGFDNSLGYDGIYFYGGTMRVANVFSMRIGYHHYCSHYGDDIFKAINSDSSFTDFNYGYKYIRMNGFVIGLSVEPTSWARVYGELNYIPENVSTIRPLMFAPGWFNSNNSNYDEDYNARIVNVGVEFTLPIFKNLGNTTIGYDLHMYEEGKIVYEEIDGYNPSFESDEPWELEHNIKIAQQVNDTTSFEISWHKGRSPINSFYFMDTTYLSFGVRFNPSNTITLIDTDK
ncbi:MAG: hypothetical protein PQJ49_03455 [Sphaerochaetaceae bacterium]|nr:hypothetical protein [Sphaerochaetaceae bacterium]MDC7248956.1 hypothetical protein [Sphaerochaetaceae bacterium]